MTETVRILNQAAEALNMPQVGPDYQRWQDAQGEAYHPAKTKIFGCWQEAVQVIAGAIGLLAGFVALAWLIL